LTETIASSQSREESQMKKLNKSYLYMDFLESIQNSIYMQQKGSGGGDTSRKMKT
jgi:hypothetical protein